MSKYIPKIGDRVLFFDPDGNFCSDAKLDVGKIGIIVWVDVPSVRVKLPDCHNSSGYWYTPIRTVKPVGQQLMLFEI